jgi:hypothetical protein
LSEAESDHLRIAARLRELLAGGASLRAAAIELKRSKSVLGNLAKRAGLYGGLSRQGRPLSPDKDRSIRRRLARGEAVRAIARAEQVSAAAVRARREAAATAELLREKLQVRFRPTNPWRCPCGALVATDPSVCCQARRPRSAKRGTNERPPPAS